MKKSTNILASNMRFGLGSATVPVAAAGVPPAALRGDVFGQRSKTAGETPALPPKHRIDVVRPLRREI
jgi:hypothetical protein